MSPCRLFIERPVATTLLTIALLIAGIIGYLKLPVSDLPNVDFPVIMVQAQQPGGSPEEVASSVAAPLERHLGQIAGLTEITSQSTQNQVRIMLQFELTRDINGAARDVEAALQAAHADMPSSLRQNPSYNKANPNGAPILVLALTSPTRTAAKLYDLASNVLQQHLSQVRGVGMVQISGSALPAVRVEMNPLKLFKFGIGFEDVRAALASANAHTPKGVIDQNGLRFTLDTNDQAESAQAYRDLIIAYRSNRPVRLADVAEVSDGVEDLRNAGFFNDQRAVIGIVFPQAGANVIHTIDQIKAILPTLQTALPQDVSLHVALDRSLTIRASLADTQATLVIGVILVVLVTLAFLRSLRMTLIPAIVVPTSIIATFAVMRLLDFSLDNMSLMALTVSTGFVVDDAIVVLENIARHIEAGVPPRQAALQGAEEVAFTVISISVSLIAVFLPILLLGGVAGRLFHELATTVSITIVISMLLSLSLTPMLASRILRAPTPQAEGSASHVVWWREIGTVSGAFFGRLITGLENGYARSLEVALRHNRLVLLSLPATVILMVALFLTMSKGFFPTEDTGMLMGHLVGDQSISFTAITQKIATVERAILQEKEVTSVAGFVGGRGSANQASLFLQLKDKSERGAAPDLMVRISRRLSNLVGAQFFLMEPGGIRIGARQGNAAYQYTLEGDSASELYTWAPRLMEALRKHPEILDLSTDVQQGGSAIVASISRDTAARMQITPQLISNTLYDAFGQRSASVIYNALNQYHVVMEASSEFWQDPNTIRQVWVATTGGTAAGGTASNTIRVRTSTTESSSSSSTQASVSSENFRNQIANSLAGGSSTSTGSAVSTGSATMVPLTFVTDIIPSRTAVSVNHQGQSVASTISFNLAKGVALDRAVQIIQGDAVSLHMPATIHGSFAGNAAQFQKSVNDEPLLILAALVAVYVVLGVLYESYVHPLTILSTLPSAGVGALLALQFFGEDFSLIAMIGVILLIGIVKKNAIMLVDFAITAERETNCPPFEAIRTACLLRFRPIIMTSLAAALGALPLVFGNGYGAEMRRPLGIAIVGGLLVSQALTLYTTPVVYLTLDRLALRFRKRRNGSFPLHANTQDV